MYYLDKFAGLEIPKNNIVFNDEISVENTLISLPGGGWFDPYNEDAPFLPPLLDYKCKLVASSAGELRFKISQFKALVFGRRTFQLERRVADTLVTENQRADARLIRFSYEQTRHKSSRITPISLGFQLLGLWRGQYQTIQSETSPSPLILSPTNPGTVHSPSEIIATIYRPISQFKIAIGDNDFTINSPLNANSSLYIDSVKRRIYANGLRCFDYQSYDEEEEEENDKWIDVPPDLSHISFSTYPASTIKIRLKYYPLYA